MTSLLVRLASVDALEPIRGYEDFPTIAG